MKRSRVALWILIAIPIVSTVGFLISSYLPALQATLTDPAATAASGPMRIVSLSPSVTEMLFVLNMGGSIVGATDHCDYPPEAKRIERVGGLGRPSLEKLLALSPDLIVGSGFERNDTLQALRNSGIRVLKVDPENIDEMFQALRQIGDAVGKRRQADAAVASMQAELQRIVSRIGDSRRTPPRVFVELWDDPLTTVGRASFVDDVIARAGGVNAAHELTQPNLRISAEKVIEWNPDVIVVAHMKRRAGSTDEISDRIGWADITAVKRGHVFCDIPADLILRPGPRLIEGVKILAQRLQEIAPKSVPATNKENCKGK